jgi:hypothetical protein
MTVLDRLHSSIIAVCPIDGVSLAAGKNLATNPPATAADVTVQYDPSATSDQQQAAESVLASFDWSTAAQAAWETSQNQTQAGTLLADTDALPIAVRALGQACLTVDNGLAAAIGQLITAVQQLASAANQNVTLPEAPPQLTLAQAQANVASIISSGAANT